MVPAIYTYSLAERKALAIPLLPALKDYVPFGSSWTVLMLDHRFVSDLELVQTSDDIVFGDGRHLRERNTRPFVFVRSRKVDRRS
jgi:hypothetical protein